MRGFDIQKLIQPYLAVSKQTDDALIPDIICLLTEIRYLLTGQTRQYYPGHLRRVNFGDGVVLDIALSVEPVTEGPDGAVVGVLAISTGELGQVAVNVGVNK